MSKNINTKRTCKLIVCIYTTMCVRSIQSDVYAGRYFSRMCFGKDTIRIMNPIPNRYWYDKMKAFCVSLKHIVLLEYYDLEQKCKCSSK